MADGGEGDPGSRVRRGADSVCLLAILKELVGSELEIRLHAFHLNHGLRGDRGRTGMKRLRETSARS